MYGALLLLCYGTILSLVQMIFSLFKLIIIPPKTRDTIKPQHVFVNCVQRIEVSFPKNIRCKKNYSEIWFCCSEWLFSSSSLL